MAKKSAKKKAKAAPVSREARKTPYTSAQLQEIVERLREQVGKVSALSRAMKDAKIGEVMVDGHAMLHRGMNQIDNFIDNATRAVREAKTSRDSR